MIGNLIRIELAYINTSHPGGYVGQGAPCDSMCMYVYVCLTPLCYCPRFHRRQGGSSGRPAEENSRKIVIRTQNYTYIHTYIHT